MGVKICHYCDGVARTKDHIVARHWYNARSVPSHVAALNKVPACDRCNNEKDRWRSDCECTLCETAWIVMAPYILPKTKLDIDVVPVVAMFGVTA